MNEPLIVDRSQVKAAAAVLARAFYNDPPMVYSLPDESRRWKCRYILETYLRGCISFGGVYAASANFESVAVWLPADKTDRRLSQNMIDTLSIFFQAGPRAAARQKEISQAMGAAHRRCIALPHQYLFFLGVEPELQGKGYASAVVRPMLQRADREGVACYLDNTRERNLPLYRHFGFETVEEYTIPGISSSVWAMVRQPGAQTR